MRGMKASHKPESGENGSSFATLGPFVSHHGDRPVVYPLTDLADNPVIDVSGCCSLALPASPQATVTELAEGEPPSEVLLTGERTVMRVANFGRAGSGQTIGLDQVTGELLDLPEGGRVPSFGRWRIVDTSDDQATISDCELSL